MGYIIHFFSTHTLLLCIIFGFFAISLWWLKFQKKLNMKWYIAPVLAASHFILGLIVMKLWAILEVGGDLENAASMRLYGAMFLLPPLYYAGAKLTKRDTTLVMDISAVVDVMGLVVGRVNCFMSGCCEGSCIVPGGTVRWPLREIELLYCVVFILYFGKKVLSGKSFGTATPILFISYGIMRFVLEWVREEYTGNIGIFHLAHIWSLIAIVIGVVMYYKVSQSNKSGRKRRKS